MQNACSSLENFVIDLKEIVVDGIDEKNILIEWQLNDTNACAIDNLQLGLLVIGEDSMTGY